MMKALKWQNILGIGVILIFSGAIIGFYIWKYQQALKLLPEAPGKQAVIASCSGCHSVEKIVYAKKRNKQAWDDTITWMQKMQGMGPLSDEERAIISEYLGKYFGPSSDLPKNEPRG